MSLQQAADNLIWLILASVLPVLLVGIVWVLLPKYVRRALKWLDDLIPGDFSALHRPASVAIAIAVSIAIIVPAAIAVIWGIGGNVDDTLQVSADFGRDVGRWAGDEGVKILIVLFITFLFQRFGTRTIPKAIESYIQQGSRNEQQVLEAELEKRIKTLSGVMVKAFSVIVVLGATFMILAQIGVNLAPLLAAAGVVGIAIGFGAQNIVRDVFAGVFIVLENQYRVETW